MEKLAELIVSLLDLLEAEGGALRENIFQIAGRCLILFGAAVFAITAIFFFMAAIYSALLLVIPKPVVLLIVGFIFAALSVGLIGSFIILKKIPPSSGTDKDI